MGGGKWGGWTQPEVYYVRPGGDYIWIGGDTLLNWAWWGSCGQGSTSSPSRRVPIFINLSAGDSCRLRVAAWGRYGVVLVVILAFGDCASWGMGALLWEFLVSGTGPSAGGHVHPPACGALYGHFYSPFGVALYQHVPGALAPLWACKDRYHFLNSISLFSYHPLASTHPARCLYPDHRILYLRASL